MPDQSPTFEKYSAVNGHDKGPTEFLAENPVSPELATAMMKLAPANHFCTKSYAEAMRADGRQIWLLGSKRGEQLVAGCYGFIRSRPLYRVLLIQSVPDVACDDVFWDGLTRFCSGHQIHRLELNGLGWSGARIPPLPGKLERYEQYDEYVLDLGDPEWEQKLPRNHRRNIKRAMRAGVTLQRTTSPDACLEHVGLMAASRERRRKRGEAINGNRERELTYSILLVEKGAGELFQVVGGGKVLSSGLVLRAAEGAWFESSGHSPEGMKCGTAHFLWYSIIRQLREERKRVLNTGETEPHSGLSRFKAGFGARPVSAERATFYICSELRKRATDAARALRHFPSAILGRIGLGGSPF